MFLSDFHPENFHAPNADKAKSGLSKIIDDIKKSADKAAAVAKKETDKKAADAKKVVIMHF